MEQIRTYRAKMLDKPDTWVYGGYYEHDGNAVIIHVQGNNTQQHTAVDPKTVGQCIGRKDKNGTWIYEGDRIINRTRGYSTSEYEVRWHNIGWKGGGRKEMNMVHIHSICI